MDIFNRATLLSISVVFIVACIYLYHQVNNFRPTMELPQQKPARLRPTAHVKTLRYRADNESILSPANLNYKELMKQISDVAKYLYRAKIHVRGTKTSEQLRQATTIVDKLLSSFGIDKTRIINRNAAEPKSVCPEIYMGTHFGAPLYHKGFERTNCSYEKPIPQLVTIAVFIEDENTDDGKRALTEFIESLHELGNIPVLFGTKSSFKPIKTSLGNIRFIDLNAVTSYGECWNKLIFEVKTPYALIARDVDILTKDARLERLVGEIEMLQVPVAAGAVRNPDGYWEKGCYQAVHRNYTLRYLDGYDESHHDCLFCDYIEGPFVASVKFLKSNKFSALQMESSVFEDWFLQLSKKKIETVVCPDSMFHIKRGAIEGRDKNWKNFLQKWNLYKIISPRGKIILSDCSKYIHKITKAKDALHPCKLDANAFVVNTIMAACEKEKLICEVDCGTTLGGVKFGKVLPWEIDADMRFVTANYSAFGKLEGYFKKNKVQLHNQGKTYTLNYQGWSVDAWFAVTLDSESLLATGKMPTKIPIDRKWSWTSGNPGLYARNRYGPEIYKHALHVRTTNAVDLWQTYQSGIFPSCGPNEKQECLNRYNEDGNLQFLDPLP